MNTFSPLSPSPLTLSCTNASHHVSTVHSGTMAWPQQEPKSQRAQGHKGGTRPASHTPLLTSQGHVPYSAEGEERWVERWAKRAGPRLREISAWPYLAVAEQNKSTFYPISVHGTGWGRAGVLTHGLVPCSILLPNYPTNSAKTEFNINNVNPNSDVRPHLAPGHMSRPM